MWRAQTSRQGRQLLHRAKRHFATATESTTSNAAPLPPPMQRPPKSGGRAFLKFLGVSIPLAAGGLLGYVWYDPEFRKQMETNVPFTKELLEYILPETNAKPEISKPQIPILAPALDNVAKDIPVTPPPPLEKPKPREAPVVESVQQQPALETKAQPEAKQKPDAAQVQSEVKRQAEEEKADNAALEVVIHKLLTNSQHLTEQAIKAQMNVADTTRNHTKQLRQAMDDTTDILNKDAQWEAVTVAFKEREEAVMRSNELVGESKRCIEKLRDVLAESKNSSVTKSNPAIYPATKRVAELTKELSTANSQVRQAESDAKVMLKYKDLVDKGKKQFQKELESLFPDVKSGRTSRKLTEEELNGLIAHAHRRIEQLQKQMAEQLAMEQQRLSTALDMQKQEDKTLTEESVTDERVRLLNEFETEKQKLELDFLVQQENEVRKQLARQAAAHSDHLKDVLTLQSEQFSKDFERQLNTKLLEEREKFQTEVSSWISRLKGIEAAIDARAASEQLARSAQDLWLACIALNSSIHFGTEDDSSVKPLREELKSILTAAKKHPFVESVASTIPQEALERGVFTEDGLRERFAKVSTVCRRLGLLNDANRSLYRYLISYLHSFFVFDNVKILSEKDFVDLDEFDNFDLVAHAQYWMDHGNLEMALRYMNQLRGEAYVAASDWIKETKLLLETRQAASTLTAYASATGLANTF